MKLRSSTRPVAALDDDPDLRRVSGPQLWVRWLNASGTWVILLDLVLILYFSVRSPNHVFWGLKNFQAMTLQGTQLALISLGVATFLAAGFIDISVGANLVLASVFGAKVMLAVAGNQNAVTSAYPYPIQAIVLGFIVCVLSGVIFGLINGFFIAVLDVNSLITTLGTTGVATGSALLLTNGTDIGRLPGQIQSGFGLAQLGPVPLPVFIALVLGVLMWAFFRYTKYGSYTLAIGSLRPSAERAGLRVKSTIVALAATSGLMAGLAGFMSLAQYGATTISGHTNDPLAAITAVVIGGTLLEGGRVNIPGVFYGVGLALILQFGLVIIGVAAFWQLIAIGAVLLVAVSIDRIRARRRQR